MHKSIDKILAQLMAANGITQVELSSRTSVGQSTISRILKPQGPKGIKEPTDKQVRPLADFFGITTDQLRGYEPWAKSSLSRKSEPPFPLPISSSRCWRSTEKGFQWMLGRRSLTRLRRNLPSRKHPRSSHLISRGLVKLVTRFGLRTTTFGQRWVADRYPMITRKCCKTSGSALGTCAKWA